MGGEASGIACGSSVVIHSDATADGMERNMTIRVDTRGYMRCVNALRKAFDAAVERRRNGEGTDAVIDDALIMLLRDALGDGGWMRYAVCTLDDLDDDGIDDCRALFARIRTTVREQGLLGWIFEMNDEAEQALDTQAPSRLMLDTWTPGEADDDALSDDQYEQIMDDAMYADMCRFEDDVRRISAALLLRWGADDRTVVTLAAQLLSEHDTEALEAILRQLVHDTPIDSEDVRDYLRERLDDISPTLWREHDERLVRLDALADAEQVTDPLWHLLRGESIDDDDLDEILTSPRMGLLAQCATQDSIDGDGDDDADLDAGRRFHHEDMQFVYDAYRTVRALSDLWDMPQIDLDRLDAIPEPAPDAGREELTRFFDEYQRLTRETRARFLDQRYPGRQGSPWFDLPWLMERVATVGGVFRFGLNLQEAFADKDEQRFASAVRDIALLTQVTRSVGLLRLPEVVLTASRTLAAEMIDDDTADDDMLHEEMVREHQASADFAEILLRRIPDAATTRPLALALLQGDLSAYSEHAAAAYATGTPPLADAD